MLLNLCQIDRGKQSSLGPSALFNKLHGLVAASGQRTVFFSCAYRKRSARPERDKIRSLLIIKNGKYLVVDTPLQSQPVAAQNRVEIKGRRKNAIPFISCCEKRIYALYMKSQIIWGATDQAIKMFDQPFTPLRVGIVG